MAGGQARPPRHSARGRRVPKGIDWKTGTCQQLGWPHRNQADIARAWKHVLGRVTSFADLEPALLGRVEELIDFTTQP